MLAATTPHGLHVTLFVLAVVLTTAPSCLALRLVAENGTNNTIFEDARHVVATFGPQNPNRTEMFAITHLTDKLCTEPRQTLTSGGYTQFQCSCLALSN